MGKSILIITLGVSLIIGFIILKLNTNATQGVETTVNKFDQTHARLIANSAVEIQLELLRQNKNHHGNFSANLFNGTYSGNTSLPDANDRIIISATGLFQGVSHYVRVDAERKDIIPPPMLGAMRITTNAFKKLTLSGGLTIDGFDHDTSGLLSIPLTDSIPGITVDTDGQRDTLRNKDLGGLSINTIVVGDDPKVQALGGGIPANKTYSIALSSSKVDWQTICEDIAASADTTIYGSAGDKPPTAYPKFNIGTIQNPKIVVVNGNVKINSKKSGGAGILVVNGNLSLEGFLWKGLIIAYKSSKIDIVLNGGAEVIGGMVLAGDKVEITAGNGGFKLLYSAQVMHLLQTNLVNSSFKILSWWE